MLATKRCRGHVSGSNPDFLYSFTKVLLNTLAGTLKALVTTVRHALSSIQDNSNLLVTLEP
jgi:hypothetical protein